MSGVQIIEVGPRDGFQPILPFIPTAEKFEFLKALNAAGLHEIEIGSFASSSAVPQLGDTSELLEWARQIEGLVPRVLVPTSGYGRKALASGAKFLVYVLSASEAHNKSNVRRTVAESISDYQDLVASLPSDVKLRLNLATAFDCPFEGSISPDRVLSIVQNLISARRRIEIGICDTTGRADPAAVSSLFECLQATFDKQVQWAFHGHDTYGLGLANVYAAHLRGVRIFDAAFAGLGGCPFAPGATGNVATEDVVFMLERMGISTGCDLLSLISIANRGAKIPGALAGGRVRMALKARCAIGLQFNEEETK